MSINHMSQLLLLCALSGCGAQAYFQRIDLPVTATALEKPWPRLVDNPELQTPPPVSDANATDLQALHAASQQRAAAAQETLILDDDFYTRRQRAQARAAAAGVR